MKHLYRPLIFLFCLFSAACDSTDKPSKKSSDGLIKQYRSDGSLKNEIPMKNGKREGTAKMYYKNGVVHQQISYVNDMKHGEAITFYESGRKFLITPYDSGKIHGLRKKFRMNGKLLAEVPYSNDEVCAGLKEYLINGKPKTIYPTIVIKEIDNLLMKNEFILRLSVSDKSKKVVFYLGDLDESGCIKKGAIKLVPQKPGILDIKYHLSPGMFLMEKLNIIAVVQTALGNSYFTQKKYNLAVENRG